MSDAKVKLDAYDLMVMMGKFDPRLSEAARAVIDRWLAKIPTEGLEQKQAWYKAMRAAAINEPEAFDPNNRDDQVMVRLAPHLFREDGSHADDFLSKVQLPDSVMRAQVQGGRAIFDVAAKDEATKQTFKTRFAAKMKLPPPKRGK